MGNLLRKLSGCSHLLVTIVSCCVLVFLSSRILSAESSEQGSSVLDIQLVWSTNYGQGEQVFFSKYKNKDWSIPIQISESHEFVFKPVSSVGNDGRIWVVWTQKDKDGSFLQFSVYNSSWREALPIDTGMKNNRAVTIIVDEDNTPWIAWAGIDTSYSDIFWSRWNGQGWEAPVQAHPDNKVPDINPALSLDDSGQIVLSWQTYVNGKYITITQSWDGRRWQRIPKGNEKNIGTKKIFHPEELPIMPDFIKEAHKATLFVKTNHGAVSIPFSRL